MAIDAISKSIVKSIADAVFKKLPVENFQAVALPVKGADPSAVDAFKAAMDPHQSTPPVEGLGTDGGYIDGAGAFHFSGDIKVPSGSLEIGTRIENRPSMEMDTEKWIGSILDVFQQESISHSDLFRVQVLSSIAKVEVTRNSSITKSIDEGLKTVLKSSS